MRRREFIALLYGTAIWPRAALAQAKRRRSMIAWLGTQSQSVLGHYSRPFLEGMRELGYTEGRDFDIVYRFAEGHYDRLPRLLARADEVIE